MDVQWYPGHMTKARRMMEENIRLVDLVIELVDARIPMSSRNPDIDALCRGKGRVVLLCKADLADPAKTEEYLEFFRQKGFLAVAADARERKAGEVVRRYVQDACREKLERDRARGIVGRPLRAMVAGIPNVGKSTFINSFAGRASTKTGNKPGVTRGKQWIRLGGGVELLDTPGILWPKFDDQRIGMRLALVGAIRDEVLDREELAVWLLQFLEEEYPGLVKEKYLIGDTGQISDPGKAADRVETEETSLPVTEEMAQWEGTGEEGSNHSAEAIPPFYKLLMEIALARRLIRKGGEPDTERAAAMLIDDCRNGRIGRISLDRPQEAEAMMTAQEAAQDQAPARDGKSGGKAPGKAARKPGGDGRLSTKNSSKSGGTGKPSAKSSSKSGGTGKPSAKRSAKSDGREAGRSAGNRKPGAAVRPDSRRNDPNRRQPDGTKNTGSRRDSGRNRNSGRKK